MATTPETDKLKKTKWYKPTLERYSAHVETCERLACEDLIEPFEKFAEEVLNTPTENRDWLLKVEPKENVEPFMRFAQYDAPRGDEMFFNTQRRSK